MSKIANVATVGERIRKLRKEKGITQKELADYLGVAVSAVNKYEAGKRMPVPETIAKMADYFNADTDYLLGRSEVVASVIYKEELIARVEILQKISDRLQRNPEYIDLFRAAANLRPEDVEFATLFLRKITTAPMNMPEGK